LKEAGRPFPTGQSVGVLKWRQQSKDESMMPLSINCWPSPSSNGSCDVNIEYELENDDLELRDVVILVPLPPGFQFLSFFLYFFHFSHFSHFVLYLNCN